MTRAKIDPAIALLLAPAIARGLDAAGWPPDDAVVQVPLRADVAALALAALAAAGGPAHDAALAAPGDPLDVGAVGARREALRKIAEYADCARRECRHLGAAEALREIADMARDALEERNEDRTP